MKRILTKMISVTCIIAMLLSSQALVFAETGIDNMDNELYGNKKQETTVNQEEGTGKQDGETINQEKGTDNQDKGTDNQDKGTDNQNKVTDNQDKVTGSQDKGTDNQDKITENQDKGTDNQGKVTTNLEEVTGNQDKGTDNQDKVTTNPEEVTGNQNKGNSNQDNDEKDLSDKQKQNTDSNLEEKGSGDGNPVDSKLPDKEDPETPASANDLQLEILAGSTITFDMDQTSFVYTGKAITPAVKNVNAVVDGNPVPLAETDYSLQYENNILVSNAAKVTITGKGSYAAYSGTANFMITPANVTACTAELIKTSYYYTGSAIQPAVNMNLAGTPISAADFAVTYSANVNVGTATAKITGKGNLTGTRTLNFKIYPVAQNLKIKAKPATLKYGAKGRIAVAGHKTKLYFKSSNPKIVAVNQRGVIKGKKNGVVTIQVTAAASKNYKKAVARVKVTVLGKQLTAANTKVTFSRKTYTYDGRAKRPSIKVRYQGKTLKKNRDYRMGYQDNINAGSAKVVIKGINNYSGKFRKVFKIRKASNPMQARISKNFVDIKKTRTIVVRKAKGDVTFTSSNPRVASVSQSGLITGKRIGTVTITVKAEGDDNYKPKTKKFKLTVGIRYLTDPDCVVKISEKDLVYDGTLKRPEVTVKYLGERLREDRDYTVTYEDNRNAGQGRIILEGTGDHYKGRRELSFTIKKAPQTNFRASLPGNRIPLGRTAQVNISGYRGEVTYGSLSPSYAQPLGGGVYKGLKQTRDGVTITIRAAGDANYEAKTISLWIQIN